MGKPPKKARPTKRNHHDFSTRVGGGGVKKNFSHHTEVAKQSTLASSQKKSKAVKNAKGGQQLRLVLPFRAADRILLVGEGMCVVS